MDLAITGLAGLAICHLTDPPAPEPADNHQDLQARLVVEFDFILTLAGGRARPICFERIQSFLLWLREYCRFRFGLVTADSFQSQQMLQTLEAKGIKTANLSIDRDKKAYLALQGGFQEHNIRLYRQHQLLKELKELIELERKIDHQPQGTRTPAMLSPGRI